jgi:hypothetical protein
LPHTSRPLEEANGTIPTQLFWRQLQQLAAGAVGQHIDRTVRKDTHVADPLVEIRQKRFLVDDLVVFTQLQTEHGLAAQTAHENARLPQREEIALIEDQAGRRDDRIPVVPRLLQT